MPRDRRSAAPEFFMLDKWQQPQLPPCVDCGVGTSHSDKWTGESRCPECKDKRRIARAEAAQDREKS